MKNKKLLTAIVTLTLGGATAMGLAFAGCAKDHEHTYSDKWGKDATGHWHYATCDDLKEGDDAYRKGFAEHVYGADNVCDVCEYEKAPPAKTEYTITLNANGGTIKGDGTVKTVDGKLANLPAAPTAAKPELTFDGWYTAAEDGEKVTTATVFDKDATIYARWKATDGIYTADGKLIEALEWIDPSDTAKKQYGGTGIELSAGTEFVLKVEGQILTHNAGTLELWTADGCHGINFNQSEGKFTVKEGDDRAFEIYAKFYDGDNSTPCWSIYITDGLKDELHAGGAYLVGGGWENASWNIAVENYIDPDNGLTVTLTNDASFKITDCLDVAEGDNRGWKYNDSKYYEVKDNVAGYLNFANVGSSGNGSVITPGEYTITVVKGEAEDDIKFVFTPAEGLEPAPVEDKFVTDGYYLVGEKFAGAAWAVKEGFYVDPTDGLTVTFEKNASFKVIRCSDGATGAPDWNKVVNYKMAEGKEEGYIDLSGTGNKTVRAAGQYTITIDASGETPLFTITPAADVEPDLTEPVYRYFIKGTAVDIGWTNTTTDKYELKETAEGSKIYELTIGLVVGEFMFYSIDEEGGAGNKFIQSDKVVEGTDCVNLDQTNIKTLEAGTYSFSYNAETEKLTISFTPADQGTPELPAEPTPEPVE